jgi:2-polyprenyl-3-methyl-5-hydroxy-6-metoxy-1,4-benzoquinol methylase
MELVEARRVASQLSGGTSPDAIKALVIKCLQEAKAAGSLLDFGAGLGELLGQLHRLGGFATLAGADLFPRPDGLDPAIEWCQQDLNDTVQIDRQFDCVVCSETIEHLENPRQTFRSLDRLLKPGGLLVLTMPNQECIRSYVGLLFGGHFTHFLGGNYPAHITALLRKDLERLCLEVNLGTPAFRFTNSGMIPKLTRFRWQSVSFGLLRGRLFSDNVAMIARKPAAGP